MIISVFLFIKTEQVSVTKQGNDSNRSKLSPLSRYCDLVVSSLCSTHVFVEGPTLKRIETVQRLILLHHPQYHQLLMIFRYCMTQAEVFI
jgi:hypothetical protein